MCAKKIDKDEKRRNIALSCFDLIYEVGMKNITVAQVAQKAGIGKGTVYEYFESKEDIIFEIVNIHIEKYHKDFLENVKNVTKTKDKIKLFFKNILDDSEETLRHLNGYKDFLSIVLSENNFAMKEFNCAKSEFFRNELEKIFLDAIKNNELKEDSLHLIDGIITYHKGLALRKMSQNSFDAKEDFRKFIDAIFKLIEVKR